jgi:hypothetical protein
MRLGTARRFIVACGALLAACRSPAFGPEATLPMPPPPKLIEPLGAFQDDVALTEDVERFALRKPSLRE